MADYFATITLLTWTTIRTPPYFQTRITDTEVIQMFSQTIHLLHDLFAVQIDIFIQIIQSSCCSYFPGRGNVLDLMLFYFYLTGYYLLPTTSCSCSTKKYLCSPCHIGESYFLVAKFSFQDCPLHLDPNGIQPFSSKFCYTSILFCLSSLWWLKIRNFKFIYFYLLWKL